MVKLEAHLLKVFSICLVGIIFVLYRSLQAWENQGYAVSIFGALIFVMIIFGLIYRCRKRQIIVLNDDATGFVTRLSWPLGALRKLPFSLSNTKVTFEGTSLKFEPSLQVDGHQSISVIRISPYMTKGGKSHIEKWVNHANTVPIISSDHQSS